MKDLTVGNVRSVIIKFTIPILFTNLLMLTYSFVDNRMVGEFVGATALAAVGATNPINTLIVGFMLGLTNGFAVITARHFGAQDYKQMKKTIGCAYVLGSLTCLFLTTFCLIFIYPLLKILNTPEDIINISKDYISIIFAGMIITFFYNVCASTLRAIGDTITPLVFLAISAFLNILLDYICMKHLNMGVKGAAYATIASQGIAAVACEIYILKKYKIIHFGLRDMKLEKRRVIQMYSSGVSMGLMNSIVALGTVTLQGAINTCGNNVIVAHSAARKISEFFMVLFPVFGMTMATFCGQNAGAGKMDRVKEGLKQSIFLTWCWCICVILMAWFLGDKLIYLVTGSKELEVLNTGAKYLRFNTLFYFVTTVICISRNAMQGIGDHITPIISSSIELIGKVMVVIVLVPFFQYNAVIITEPLVWFLMVIPLLIRLKKIFYSKSEKI